MINRREFISNVASLLSYTVIPNHADAERFSDRSVDTHAHVFLRSLPMAPHSRYVPTYDATLADYIGELNKHKISNGVLIQPSFLGTDNSFLLHALSLFPNRLRGVVVIDPSTDLEKLDRFNASGCVGIRLNLIGQPDPNLATPEWSAVFGKLRKLGWQVEVQVEASRLERIVKPLLPVGLSLVVDHFGRPDPKLGTDDPGFQYLLELGATRQMWVKLSGAYRNGAGGRGEQIAHEAMPMLRKSFGLDRLLWGSDWPHTQFEGAESYDRALALLHTLLPNAHERAIVLWHTPAQLFRFAGAPRNVQSS